MPDAAPQAAEPPHDSLYLLAYVPLDQHLEFMEADSPGVSRADRARSADDWRAADERRRALEEAGRRWLDAPPLVTEADRRVRPLPAEMEPFAAALTGHPVFRRAFATVP